MPHGLHLDYDLDFQTRRVDDIAPTLSSTRLPGLVGNIHQLERLVIPGKPAPFRVDGDLWSPARAPPRPDVPSPSHNDGRASKRPTSQVETPKCEPPGQGESPLGQPPSETDKEEVAEITILEDDDITMEEPQVSSTPRNEWFRSRK